MTITDTSPAPTDLQRSVLVDAQTGEPIRPADIVGSTVELVTRNGDRKRKALVRGLGSGLLIVAGRWPFGDGVQWRDYVPVIDITPDSRIVRDVPRAPVMTVNVSNRGQGRSYQGVWITTVTIVATCPHCGGPRGPKRNGRIIEDGWRYQVDNWDNPCGHVDMFEDVLIEAGAHLPRHLREGS